MSVNFNDATCQSKSNKKLFGIRDDVPPARIDEVDGACWIAVVINENLHHVTFTAIDNCIDIFRTDGKMDKRCDGMLTYSNTIIFVELKERNPASGAEWVKDGERQLKITIAHFEKTLDAVDYEIKRAYIANSEKPKFKESQKGRMEKFYRDTNYVLRIENRIDLE